MSSTFEVLSVLGKKIRLTINQQYHIEERHPEFKGQTENIRQCLEDPEAILYDTAEDNYQYYKYFEKTPIGPKCMLVIARHLNGDGFVITAIFVPRGKIRSLNKECVYGKIENLY